MERWETIQNDEKSKSSFEPRLATSSHPQTLLTYNPQSISHPPAPPRRRGSHDAAGQTAAAVGGLQVSLMK